MVNAVIAQVKDLCPVNPSLSSHRDKCIIDQGI